MHRRSGGPASEEEGKDEEGRNANERDERTNEEGDGVVSEHPSPGARACRVPLLGECAK